MTSASNVNLLIKKARELGARDARRISPRTIVTARWVRLKCQYGCGGYGLCLTCPPFSPSPDETARMLRDYRAALLIHGDDHTDVTRIATALEREAFLAGFYKAFAMGSGPCRCCPDCNLKTKECRHPQDSRPAMEACGIDVYQTARNNGYPLEVVRNQDDPQNYYGLLLLE